MRHENKISGKRITPACAGKTWRQRRRWWQTSDHPRMRGEDRKIIFRHTPKWGSPPHARGRRRQSPQRHGIWGITPACAGKTGGGLIRGSRGTDHPRMRGENGTRPAIRRPARGSPPHARGKQALFVADDFAVRITPACAGKTPMKGPYDAHEPDHPRMRGENRLRWLNRRRFPGSPPHARGKRDDWKLDV